MAGFETVTAAGMQPVTIYNNQTPNDPAAVLDSEPLRKVTALHQRAEDIFALVPPFEDVQEVRIVKAGHANRIADLLRPRAEGGFGQDEHAGAVIAERKKLQRASDELRRLDLATAAVRTAQN